MNCVRVGVLVDDNVLFVGECGDLSLRNVVQM